MRGQAEVQGRALAAGDGAAVVDETLVTLRATEAAELLLIDVKA